MKMKILKLNELLAMYNRDIQFFYCPEKENFFKRH